MRAFWLLLLITFFSGKNVFLMASQVSKEDALKKAQLFYIERFSNRYRIGGTDFQLVYSDTCSVVCDASDSVYACFYVFNAGNNNGFVVVSGDDVTTPILAYSAEGSFQKDNIPENLRYWLKFYHQELEYLAQNTALQATFKSRSKSRNSRRSTHSSVEPLLGNIKWNQRDPYNIFCPYSKKYAKRASTGCNATAMAQVMKYYEWPKSGIGSTSYSFDLDSVSTTVSVNFGGTTYDWDNMLDSYGGSSKPVQDSAVALLMYHCGVASRTTYCIGGSSAYCNDVAYGMMTNFGYDSDMQLNSRFFSDHESWTEMLMNELDAGRPVLYSGISDAGGHEFICDGYDRDGLFHFNWGWGGKADGYYSIEILNPGISTVGFTNGQFALTGIQKPDGVNNVTYQVIDCKRMTCSKETIADINSERFDIDFGILNQGLNCFSGVIAAGLYQNGLFLDALSVSQMTDIGSLCYNLSLGLKKLSLKDRQEGEYRLSLVYKPKGGSIWYPVKGNSMFNTYLDITISGSKAIIKAPDISPHLVQTSDIRTKGKICQGRTGLFDVSVKNDGTEYYSYLSLHIQSATDSTVGQNISYGPVVIGKGSTKVVQFSDAIGLAPGSYYACLMYDTTNSVSLGYSKKIDQSTFLPFKFTIYSVDDTTESVQIANNPVGESIEIITDETVLKADIYDLSGRKLGQFNNRKTIPAGDLEKGVYLLRVTTEGGDETIRFIK